MYEQRAKPVPAKARYHAKDLQDWARLYGLKIGWPSVFPVNSVKAMRGCLAADETGLPAGLCAGRLRGLLGPRRGRVTRGRARAAGGGRGPRRGGPAETRIAEPELKAKLRANTDELIGRGGFGSPTMFVDGDDMYFGNDRLPLVRRALREAR